MSELWQQPIARIQGDNNNVVGSGAVVEAYNGRRYLLTCAHVVNEAIAGRSLTQADRPTAATIQFSLPAVSAEKTYQAAVCEWFAPLDDAQRTSEPVSDIAILDITDELPNDMHLLHADRFTTNFDAAMPVSAFGFSSTNGAIAQGQLNGIDSAKQIQLTAEQYHSTFIAPGFSGAPLFDDKYDRIIGMVVSIKKHEQERVAYAQSVHNLQIACPQIAKPYLGLRDYDEQQANNFYGRTAFIEQMVAKSTLEASLQVTLKW